jgi:hypothetical protein
LRIPVGLAVLIAAERPMHNGIVFLKSRRCEQWRVWKGLGCETGPAVGSVVLGVGLDATAGDVG